MIAVYRIEIHKEVILQLRHGFFDLVKRHIDLSRDRNGFPTDLELAVPSLGFLDFELRGVLGSTGFSPTRVFEDRRYVREVCRCPEAYYSLSGHLLSSR